MDAAIVGCTRTGEDGATRTGAPWPEPRFAEHGERTVRDGLTGLVWTRDANPAGGPRTWQDALDYIKTLNDQGHLGWSDWRLPNVNELESLVNKQPNLAEWLQAQGFEHLQADYYWTSSTYASFPRYAWSVGLHGGIVAGHDKADVFFVWPVRRGEPGTVSLPRTGQTACHDRSGTVISCAGTGQDGESQAGAAWPHPRFVENAAGIMSDRLTGLAWNRESRAPGPAVCKPGGRKVQRDALQFVVCLNANSYLGRQDWRLPNRNELATLVNRGAADSAAWLNAQGFTRALSGNYWSSTTFAYAPRNGWIVNLHDGAVTTYPKRNELDVWPVCGAE